MKNGAVSASVPISALSPGQVFTTEGAGVSGAVVVARDLNGHVLDTVQTSRSGTFTLVTPVQGPFVFEVVGTGVVEVPFMPLTTIVVVLP